MTAARAPITIERGATFRRVLQLTNADDSIRDLTGHQVRMQVRASFESAQPVVALTSTPAAGITIDTVLGEVEILIAASATAQLAPLTGVYDVELQAPDGTVYRLLEGVARITPEVTR